MKEEETNNDELFGKLQEKFSNSIKKTMSVENNDSNLFSFNGSKINNNNIQPIQSIETGGITSWDIFKYGLIAIVFFILIINIYTFLKTGTDAITYYSNYFFNKTKKKVNNLETNITNLADDTHDMLDLNAKNLSKMEVDSTSKLQDTVESGLKNIKKSKKDKADKDFFDKDGNNVEVENKEKTIENKEKTIENKEKLVKNEDTNEVEKKVEDEYNVAKNYIASSVLDLKLSKTPGYCYVGTDRNIRTCVKINTGDQCMSGKVFPTEDLCINPNLKE